MPIEREQINDLMDSSMYWKDDDPLHEDTYNFVKGWFEKNTTENEDSEDKEKFGSNPLEENEGLLFGIKEEEYIPQKPRIQATDDEIIKRNVPDITKWEQPIEHAYKDSKGVVTTGKGIRSDNHDFYHSLDWQNPQTKQKGTKEEIEDDFQSIGAAPEGNYKAKFYEPYTILRLSKEETDRQVVKHLQSDLQQIKNNVKNFDKLPRELQDVIIDIQYNTGHIEKFPLFLKAIQEKNIRDMIIESHRKDIPEERNKAIGKKILNISNWDY